MAELYPEIEPYEHGRLDVGNGNQLYWEVCGSPNGKPAVVLHGGPGSGCTPGSRRPFDPTAYRIIVFDQRNCGRSTPSAGDPATDLSANTTWHLLEDMERLRRHLGIERWLVFGASWGSTLALAYAQHYPHRVSELILVAITTTDRWEIDWITRGIGQFYPEAFEQFRNGVPEEKRGGNLAAAYNDLLESPDADVREKAARDWCTWEDAIVAISADHKPSPRFADPNFRYTFSRLVTHYWRNAAWLEEGALLRNACGLAGVPGALIHGRLDLTCPLITAWKLSQVWTEAELTVVGGAGHNGSHLGMTETLVAATDRFR